MSQSTHYKAIVVLTGAGVSAESGLRTFRDSNGLWEDHRIEDVASPEGFARNPDLVHRFYNARRAQLLSNTVQSNPCHQALANFEREFTGDFLLVTQNVDDLHERCGSNNLIHMHGELLNIRCQHCGHIESTTCETSTNSICQHCQTSNVIRPHIVWFGEMPLEMDRIYQALEQCDLFVAIGTSGQVYPAAGFFQIAQQQGAHTVELNLESSQQGSEFKQAFYGPATSVVPEFFSNLLGACPGTD